MHWYKRITPQRQLLIRQEKGPVVNISNHRLWAECISLPKQGIIHPPHKNPPPPELSGQSPSRDYLSLDPIPPLPNLRQPSSITLNSKLRGLIWDIISNRSRLRTKSIIPSMHPCLSTVSLLISNILLLNLVDILSRVPSMDIEQRVIQVTVDYPPNTRVPEHIPGLSLRLVHLNQLTPQWGYYHRPKVTPRHLLYIHSLLKDILGRGDPPILRPTSIERSNKLPILKALRQECPNQFHSLPVTNNPPKELLMLRILRPQPQKGLFLSSHLSSLPMSNRGQAKGIIQKSLHLLRRARVEIETNSLPNSRQRSLGPSLLPDSKLFPFFDIHKNTSVLGPGISNQLLFDVRLIKVPNSCFNTLSLNSQRGLIVNCSIHAIISPFLIVHCSIVVRVSGCPGVD